MRKRIVAVRTHFNRHRFVYGMATGLSVAGYLAMKRADEWNEFLDKHDLLEEFYMPEVSFTVGAPE